MNDFDSVSTVVHGTESDTRMYLLCESGAEPVGCRAHLLPRSLRLRNLSASALPFARSEPVLSSAATKVWITQTRIY